MKIGGLKYEKEIIIHQADNERDRIVVSICLIEFYNIQNPIFSKLIIRNIIYSYQ